MIRVTTPKDLFLKPLTRTIFIYKELVAISDCLLVVVGTIGFEPTASCSQSKRSTRLS